MMLYKFKLLSTRTLISDKTAHVSYMYMIFYYNIKFVLLPLKYEQKPVTTNRDWAKDFWEWSK